MAPSSAEYQLLSEPFRQRFQARIDSLTSSLQSLLSAPVFTISDVLAHKPPGAFVPGVYLISLPDNPEETVYAGLTRTGTVFSRLRDHCNTRETSDLSGMLPNDPTHDQKVRSYPARWLQVDDGIERSRLEHFAIAVLNPPFNKSIQVTAGMKLGPSLGGGPGSKLVLGRPGRVSHKSRAWRKEEEDPWKPSASSSRDWSRTGWSCPRGPSCSRRGAGRDRDLFVFTGDDAGIASRIRCLGTGG